MVPASSRRRLLKLCALTGGVSTAGCLSSSNGATKSETETGDQGETESPTTQEPTTASTRTSRPLESCPVYEQPYPNGWPLFGYDARNTGANPNSTGPKTQVEELWRFETDQWVECSPAVAAETVYITSRDRNVYALSASDGTEQWRFETGISETDAEDTSPSQEAMWSSPTVVDGTVYVGGGNYEVGGEDGVIKRISNHSYLYALDAETGDLEWKFQPEAMAESSPTVVDGTVYFACIAGNVYALDAGDGQERWRFSTEEDTAGGFTATPAVADCTVFVGSWGKKLYALNARDGSIRWEYEASGAVSASPAVSDGTVYIGVNNGGPVRALSAETGKVKWEYPTSGSIVASSPAVADGVVYIGDYSGTHDRLAERLNAIDAHSGEEVWTANTSGYIWSSPAVVDGVVYVGDLENVIYGFDAADGTLLWRYEVGDNVRPSPTVVDGVVYIGSSDGNVYALTDQ